MTREEFLCLFHEGATMRELADKLRLTDEELGAAILEARFNKDDRERRESDACKRRGEISAALIPPLTTKLWCTQCDRLVHREEAVRCWSKFCAAKAEAA
jgi:hypothetical protein